MVEAHGLSNAGPVRKTNEDSFISDPALQLFMVADGMGGHAAGEIASSFDVALTRGTRDNVTAILVRFHGDQRGS